MNKQTNKRLLRGCGYFSIGILLYTILLVYLWDKSEEGAYWQRPCELSFICWHDKSASQSSQRKYHYKNDFHWEGNVLTASETSGSKTAYEACEFVQHNDLVRAPLNAWSSFAFYIPALLLTKDFFVDLYRGFCEFSTTGDPDLFIGSCILFLSIFWNVFQAVASFGYHASISHDLNWWDITAMYCLMFHYPAVDCLLLLKLRFASKTKWPVLFASWSLMYLSYICLVFSDAIHFLFDFVIAASGIACLCGCILLNRSSIALTKKDSLMGYTAGFCLLSGFTLKALDNKLPCAPHSTFQLTAIFHVIVGIGCALAAYLHRKYLIVYPWSRTKKAALRKISVPAQASKVLG